MRPIDGVSKLRPHDRYGDDQTFDVYYVAEDEFEAATYDNKLLVPVPVAKVLIEIHPNVATAAVVSIPDPTVSEIVG